MVRDGTGGGEYGPFLERGDEEGALRAAWMTARAGNPTVVTVLGDPGIGKTRLVHAFYEWLSAGDGEPGSGSGADRAGYWPDRLPRRGSNLAVNPAAADCGRAGQEMPFLWWGMRLADAEGRNALPVSALPAHVPALRAHLGALDRAGREDARRRAMLSGGLDLGGDVGLEVVAHGAAVVADVAVPGFTLVKTVYQKARTWNDIRRERARDRVLDTIPLLQGGRGEADLLQALVDDLRRVAHAPPGGLAPRPVVVFIDDVHWITQDASVPPFLEAVLARAGAERWPLLVLLTAWEHRWQEEACGGHVRALCAQAAGVAPVEVRLAPVADLGPVLDAALPGLTARQRAAMLARADGNPEHLEVLVRAFAEAPRWFEGRDTARPLTADGEAALDSFGLADLAAARLRSAARDVRQALAIAASIGPRFPVRLAVRACADLGVASADAALARAEDPLCLVTLGGAQGSFRQRAIHEAALAEAPNHFEAERIARALAAAARSVDLAGGDGEEDHRADLLTEQFRLLARSAIAEDRAQAYRALAELAGHHLTLGDYRTAGVLAGKWLSGLHSDTFEASADDSASVDMVAEALEHAGRLDEATDLRLALLRAVRAFYEAAPTDAARADLRLDLQSAADAVEKRDGPDAAEGLWRENLFLAAETFERTATPAARTSFAIAMFDLGRNRFEAGDITAALPLLSDAAELQADIMARAGPGDDDAPQAPLLLARMRLLRGQALLRSEGLDAARGEFDAALALVRESGDWLPERAAMLVATAQALVQAGQAETAVPFREEARTLLAGLADSEVPARAMVLRPAVNMLHVLYLKGQPGREGEAAAALAEALAEARAIAARVQTPAARNLLATVLKLDALERLRAGEGAAARDRAAEAVLLARQAEAAAGTREARAFLATALGLLGGCARNADGDAAALPAFVEHAGLLRALHREASARDAAMPRELIAALCETGDIHLRLGDAAAADEAWREGLELAETAARADEAWPSVAMLREAWLLTDRLRRCARRRFAPGDWWRYTRRSLALRGEMAGLLHDRGMSLGEMRRVLLTGDGLESADSVAVGQGK
ncbi:MAG: hypothetical protein LPL00_10260 [Alphaproteobacteria bacterium]|nr:hypothetical protein [Alphaproteobacteria bacterium]MDX5370053.1 hypothetical protein [Alphaproteobacteria bacterium]MDX5464631.1 hypothetical protein [Alphaproteobacteria bacterium]